MAIVDRVKKAWNAFVNVEPNQPVEYSGTASYGTISPSRPRPRYDNERSIISSIYTRIGIDVADVVIRHAKLDEFKRYSEDLDSRLNDCLTLEPNMDQGPRAFRQDIAMTLFDHGVAALVPVDTTVDPNTKEIFDIFTLRVGRITRWLPRHIGVDVWNEAKGLREEITLEKKFVAIVENPLYSVMNAPNSTLQRLIRKLSLLDTVDEAAGSGKLDLIIQLPYVIKSEARRQSAEQRRQDIEFQLRGSQYGIAYTDGTEKITQLNRPAENNLLKQIEYLTGMLYSQLGITTQVMDGTADEATMINYHNRTIKPIVDAIIEAMQRSFIGLQRTKQLEKIVYFRDPFKLVPVSQLAEVADKFTRNEIFSSNEMRGYMGVPPSKDPKADQLVNSNMPQAAPAEAGPSIDELDSVMNEVLGGLEKDIDALTEKVSNE